jgi:cytochrome c biogenesis protein CcmG, thiol:disulfide interchange protein DsbE
LDTADPVRDAHTLDRRRQQRLIWIATSVVVVAVAALTAVLVAGRGGTSAPGPATPSAADLAAPKPLQRAAAAIGFHPEPIPGIGKIEDDPASAAVPATNSALLAPGTPAPGFALKTPLGATVSLHDFAGKALLLEFFATSCPHCQAEAPHLERLYRSLDHSRYAFASVNADGEGAPSIYAFHRYFGLTYPALIDVRGRPGSWHSPGPAGPVTAAYKVVNFPTFYVISPSGRVAWAANAEEPTAAIEQELRRAAAGG